MSTSNYKVTFICNAVYRILISKYSKIKMN